jgi:hypothetical protein
MNITTAATTNEQTIAAKVYRERMMVETLCAFAGLLNISESPFFAIGNRIVFAETSFVFVTTVSRDG